MRFNKHKEAFEESMQGNGNWFYNQLPEERRIMLRRAFGLSMDRSPIRYERMEKTKKGEVGAQIKEKPVFYQDDARNLEAKKWVEESLDFFAVRIGASKSQVVHAIVTGVISALASAIERRIEAASSVVYITAYNERGEEFKKRHIVVDIPIGYVYQGNPEKWDREDFVKAIQEQWGPCVGVLTKYEQDRAGRDAEVTKAKESGNVRNFNTSKKGVMKGVQVTNAKKAVKRKATVGA